MNLGGTFYYLCSFLDGASRAVVHEILDDKRMWSAFLERAKELYPERGLESSRIQYISAAA